MNRQPLCVPDRQTIWLWIWFISEWNKYNFSWKNYEFSCYTCNKLEEKTHPWNIFPIHEFPVLSLGKYGRKPVRIRLITQERKSKQIELFLLWELHKKL